MSAMHKFSLAVAFSIACSSPTPAGPTTPSPNPTAAQPAAPSPSGPTSCEPENPESPNLAMQAERIGGLKLGATSDEVVALFGEPEAVTGPEDNAVEGGVNWTWSYAAKGLSVELGAEDENAAKSVGGISISAGSDLKTRFGIGIGAPLADVKRAYGPCLDPDSGGNSYIAGSVYGGVIFSIADDQTVESIFVGAAAE